MRGWVKTTKDIRNNISIDEGTMGYCLGRVRDKKYSEYSWVEFEWGFPVETYPIVIPIHSSLLIMI